MKRDVLQNLMIEVKLIWWGILLFVCFIWIIKYVRQIVAIRDPLWRDILECKWHEGMIALLTDSEILKRQRLACLTTVFAFCVAEEMRPRCWSWDRRAGCESSWARIRNRSRKSKDYSRQDHLAPSSSYLTLEKAKHERHCRGKSEQKTKK